MAEHQRSNDRVTDLIRTLTEAERELQTLCGGELDAVLGGGGRTYLLREAQEKLRYREAAQRQFNETQLSLLNALPANIALLDSDGTIVAVNDSWRKFAWETTLSASDCGVGRNYIEESEAADGAAAEDARAAAAGIRRVLGGELESFAMEYACHPPDARRWFRLMSSPLSDPERAGAVVMHIDITDRKLAELRLARLNRLYQVLSHTNEKIVRATDVVQLFQDVCRIAVEDGQFRLAAVLKPDFENHRLHPFVWAGNEDGYFSEVSIDLFDDALSRGTIGSAMRTGKYDVCNDFAGDPRMSPWKDAALLRGYRSTGSFPIKSGGRMIGVLLLSADEVDYFEEDEIELLQSVAENLAFASDSLESRQERERVEVEVRDASRKFAELIRIQQAISGAEWSPKEAMTLMATRAQSLMAASGAAVALVEGSEMVFEAGAGTCKERVGLRLPREGCFCGLCAETGSVLVCTDAETDSRVNGEACRRAGIRSMIAAPVRVGARVIGALKVESAEPNAFSVRDAQSLHIVAAMLGRVIHRREMEELVRNSEREYRLMFQSNPLPMWTFDCETLRFLAVNDAAVERYGYSREEFLGMPMQQLLLPEGAAAFEKRLANPSEPGR